MHTAKDRAHAGVPLQPRQCRGESVVNPENDVVKTGLHGKAVRIRHDFQSARPTALTVILSPDAVHRDEGPFSFALTMHGTPVPGLRHSAVRVGKTKYGGPSP